jgi:hypothetical protein
METDEGAFSTCFSRRIAPSALGLIAAPGSHSQLDRKIGKGFRGVERSIGRLAARLPGDRTALSAGS